MFEDSSVFDPNRDAKVPLKRTPWALAIRFCGLSLDMLFSAHPADYFVWLRSMLRRRATLSYPLPWITFDATRHILLHITPASSLFEFGGGNSTLYWAPQVASISVTENDRSWFELLQRTLKERSIGNVTLNYADSKEAYVRSIESAPLKHFDVIVVDGAYRRECALAAIEHLKPGGLLVVDNTDWHWFHELPLAGVPADWQCTAHSGYAPMIGYKSETTVYVRPA